MTATDVKYSVVALNSEIASRIFRLYERVYGDPQNFIKRWEWEFVRNPRNAEILIYCAEMQDELVGITIRNPLRLRYKGETIRAWIATNSMVAPETRGKGVVRELYRMAYDGGDLQISKGTAPGMYEVLKKMGYRDIFPNSFQVCYLRPFRIMLQKIFNLGFSEQKPFVPADGDEMQQIFSIPESVSTIDACDGIVKDAVYLRWRYLQSPVRQYHLFVRHQGGKPVSLLVLRSEGTLVYLVDLIWDRRQPDEPAVSVAFARKAACRMGAYRLKAWTTAEKLRNVLLGAGFLDRGESPKCSFYIKSPDFVCEWQNINLVHGDGDIDYL